jgi:hypothetical protein
VGGMMTGVSIWPLDIDELVALAFKTAGRGLSPDERRQYGIPDAAKKEGRGEAIEAARHVVRSVLRAARENASSMPNVRRQGDELASWYVRQAALAAAQLPKDAGLHALLTGIGIALDDSDVLLKNPLTRDFCKEIESSVERAERLKVLGSPTMRGRRDLAQHFAVSAFLTAELGAVVADTAGAAKELMDALGGSGFSFADLAADQAGIMFAGRVLSGEFSLRNLAERFSVTEYLPSVDGLPEGLSAEAFQRDYTGASAGRYEKLREDIRSRVRSLPPYRSLSPGVR